MTVAGHNIGQVIYNLTVIKSACPAEPITMWDIVSWCGTGEEGVKLVQSHLKGDIWSPYTWAHSGKEANSLQLCFWVRCFSASTWRYFRSRCGELAGQASTVITWPCTVGRSVILQKNEWCFDFGLDKNR